MEEPKDRRPIFLAAAPATARGSDAPAVSATVARAMAVLAVHIEREGMCNGCIETWARLAPFPCEQRRWAQAVVRRD